MEDERGNPRTALGTPLEKGELKEGQAILGGGESKHVFFNPSQRMNRDLSILALATFRERIQPSGRPFVGLTLVEPLAATGLRSIRYLKELEGTIRSIIANDLDDSAVSAIHSNCLLNNIPPAKIQLCVGDGNELMHVLQARGSGAMRAAQRSPPGSALTVAAEEVLCCEIPDEDNEDWRIRTISDLYQTSRKDCGKESGENSGGQNNCENISKTGENNCENISKRGENNCQNISKRGENKCENILKGSENKCENMSKTVEKNAENNIATNSSEKTSNSSAKTDQNSNTQNTKCTSKIYNRIIDIIDLDPYGSVAPFLDSAIQCIRNGGLLCLTSTDMQVLCGNTPEVAFYRYGSSSTKANYSHELSLRLLISSVISVAAKYKKIALPLMSCSVDFYVRAFVQIWDSPAECKQIPLNSSLIYQCAGCESFGTMPMLREQPRPAPRTKKARENKPCRINKGENNKGENNIGENNKGENMIGENDIGENMIGENDIGENNKGENDIGENNKGENDIGENNKGENNKGENDIGENNKGENDIGEKNKGENDIGDNNKGENNKGENNIGENNIGENMIGENDIGENNKGENDIGENMIGGNDIGENVRELRKVPTYDGFTYHSSEASTRVDKNKNKSLKPAPFLPTFKPICEECGGVFRLFGPVYSGPLFQKKFVQQAVLLCNQHLQNPQKVLPGLSLVRRIHGTLQVMLQELPDVPLYYSASSLCMRAGITMLKPAVIRTALKNLGYRVSYFHRDPLSLKTDAPNDVVFDIIRQKQSESQGTESKKRKLLLERPIGTKNIDFEKKEKIEKKAKMSYWLPNPLPNWGPKPRHTHLPSQKPF